MAQLCYPKSQHPLAFREQKVVEVVKSETRQVQWMIKDEDEDSSSYGKELNFRFDREEYFNVLRGYLDTSTIH